MIIRKLVRFLSLFFISMLIFQTAYAADIISNRTGTIKITMPDGTVLTISKDEPLPEEIPAGSTIEILDGSADIAAPQDGSIQVVIGDTEATLTTGQAIAATLDAAGVTTVKGTQGAVETATKDTKTVISAGQEAKISVDKNKGGVKVASVVGKIETVTGNTKAVIDAGQAVKIGLDESGNAKVANIAGGVIETVTGGVKVQVTSGSEVKVNVDTTGKVGVDVVTGEGVVVTPPTGEAVIVAPGEKIETPGIAPDQGTTAPATPVETPAEKKEEKKEEVKAPLDTITPEPPEREIKEDDNTSTTPAPDPEASSFS